MTKGGIQTIIGAQQVRNNGKDRSSSKRMKNELQNHQNSLMQQYVQMGPGQYIAQPPQKFVSQSVPSQPGSALKKFA